MTYISFEIYNYSISIHRPLADSTTAVIKCNCGGPIWFFRNALWINFYPPHIARTAENYISPFTFGIIKYYTVVLSVSSEKYVWILDLLRNENPVYCSFETGSPESVKIEKI